MKRFKIAFVLVALVGTAGAAHAQTPDSAAAQQGTGNMMQMGSMADMMSACPMMAAMDQGPEAALEHADELQLTDEQRRRLEEVKQARRDARDVLTAEQRTKLGELRREQAMQRMERMMRMMNMMMRMTDGMGEMGHRGMAMRDTSGQR